MRTENFIEAFNASAKELEDIRLANPMTNEPMTKDDSGKPTQQWTTFLNELAFIMNEYSTNLGEAELDHQRVRTVISTFETTRGSQTVECSLIDTLMQSSSSLTAAIAFLNVSTRGADYLFKKYLSCYRKQVGRTENSDHPVFTLDDFYAPQVKLRNGDTVEYRVLSSILSLMFYSEVTLRYISRVFDPWRATKWIRSWNLQAVASAQLWCSEDTHAWLTAISDEMQALFADLARAGVHNIYCHDRTDFISYYSAEQPISIASRETIIHRMMAILIDLKHVGSILYTFLLSQFLETDFFGSHDDGSDAELWKSYINEVAGFRETILSLDDVLNFPTLFPGAATASQEKDLLAIDRLFS